MNSLQGRNVLVTGGGRGIGAACARALAAQGAHVIVAGRNADVLTEVASEIDGESLVVDLANRADVDRALALLLARSIDIVINNAGIAESATLSDTTDDIWDRTMEINATAPFRIVPSELIATIK